MELVRFVILHDSSLVCARKQYQANSIIELDTMFVPTSLQQHKSESCTGEAHCPPLWHSKGSVPVTAHPIFAVGETGLQPGGDD